MTRYLGIDFSGGAAPWKARCATPSVWIATVEDDRLADIRPVQALPGDAPPFERLVAHLSRGDFRAAGIDAPFSLPARHMPRGGHRALLARIGAMPCAADRPFPPGEALVAFARSVAEQISLKPSRETERTCGAVTRSALWNGARPGAPFAAACLRLLHLSRAPLWPWSEADGMLVESFPAAQLRQWDLPNKSYNGADGRPQRETILAGLRNRVGLDRKQRALLLDSADALDAVIASFGARAAATAQLVRPPPVSWRTEGAIAVHP